MDYIAETNAFLYTETKRAQQEDLESYINECVVLAESSNIVSRLKAFNEAEGTSAIQKVKDALKTFIDFIKQIFSKFVNRLQRFVGGNKKWLEDNKSIIINNPFKYQDVTTYDYEVGIKRMVNAAIPAFDNYDNIKDKLATDKDCYEWMADAIKFTDYTYDTKVKFFVPVTDFFRGGKDQIVISGNKVNLTNIYNYCYNYNDMVNGIKKDQETLESSMNAITAAINKKAATMSVDNNTSSNTNNQQNNATSTTTQNQASEKPVTDVKDEHAAFSSVYGAYITEADGPTFGAAKDSNNSGPQMKAANGAGSVGDQNATASNNMKNVDYNGQKSDDVQNKNIENINNNNNASEIKTMSDACLRYRTAASAVFSAKLTVAEKCYKDYLKILIAHVDSYLGRDQKNNKEADVPTDYRETQEYKDLSSEDQTSIDKNLSGVKDAAEKRVSSGEEIAKAVTSAIDSFVDNKSISKKAGDALKQMVAKATGTDLLTKLKNISASMGK